MAVGYARCDLWKGGGWSGGQASSGGGEGRAPLTFLLPTGFLWSAAGMGM